MNPGGCVYMIEYKPAYTNHVDDNRDLVYPGPYSVDA